jgi:hypothetical protein
MMMYHFPSVVGVSRRFVLALVIALGVALLIAASRSTPFIFDAIASAIDWISQAPLVLFFVFAMLIGTIAAGAWAISMGIREQSSSKRVRIGRRRRIRI